MISTKIKTYKIFIDSKLFANIRGASPAEVAKKTANKILRNSLNRVRFSIQEKTGKIRYYDAKRENLVRPYHKNGKLIKYRIVVKKLGKQVGGTFPPNLEDESDPIFQFFPKEEYTIQIRNLEFYITSKTDWCITFFINPNELFIGQLNKCNDKTGTDNLLKLIKYAEYLKSIDIINKIDLYDASTIYNKKISLALLSILSTGISWYNRFGFISEYFEEEEENNAKFLKMSFQDFFNECIPKIIEKKIKYYYKELNDEIQELQSEIQKNFNKNLNSSLKIKRLDELSKEKAKRNVIPINDLKEKIRIELFSKRDEFLSLFGNKDVKTLFTEIKNRLRKYKELSQEELDKITELFEYIDSSGIIIYDENLTRML